MIGWNIADSLAASGASEDTALGADGRKPFALMVGMTAWSCVETYLKDIAGELLH